MALPRIDPGGFGLEHPGGFNAGQSGQGPIFRAERDVILGLGHHRRLAGDGIAQHREAAFGADHEGEEAVQIIEAGFQRLGQISVVADPGRVQGQRRDLSAQEVVRAGGADGGQPQEVLGADEIQSLGVVAEMAECLVSEQFLNRETLCLDCSGNRAAVPSCA